MMLTTTPGRSVRFSACKGVIVNNGVQTQIDGDVLTVLRRPHMKVEFSRNWWDWVPGWMERAGRDLQAEIVSPSADDLLPPEERALKEAAVPEGWTLGNRPRGHKPGCPCRPCKKLDAPIAA